MVVLAMLHGSADAKAAAAKSRKAGPAQAPARVDAAPQPPMTFSGACTAGDRIVIAAVGDLLFHDALQRQALVPKAGFGSFFSGVEPILKGADITYGNLEGPAARAVAAGGGNARDPGGVVDGKVYGRSKGALIYNYHPSAVADLKAAGFKVVSTANNHAADRGSLGIERTIDALEAAGLAYTGTRRRGPELGDLAGAWTTVTEAKGVRVAWLACTYGTNGMRDRHAQILQCYRDREIVMEEIAAAAADPEIDAVILTPHWGLEGSHTPLRSDRAYAREAIEAGASAVIGTHPHVLQPWERIKTEGGRDGLVVYSTGNFISNQHTAAQRSGAIVLLEVVKPAGEVDKKAKVSAAGFVPTWVEKQGRKENSSGHRVVEQTGAGADAAAAWTKTLKLLPAANRVAMNDFRALPRPACPPVPEPQMPSEPAPVASADPGLPAEAAPPPTTQVAAAETSSPPLTTLLPLPIVALAGELALSSSARPIRPLPEPRVPSEMPKHMVRARAASEGQDACDDIEPFVDDENVWHRATPPKKKTWRKSKPRAKGAPNRAPAKPRLPARVAAYASAASEGEVAAASHKRRTPAAKGTSGTELQTAPKAAKPDKRRAKKAAGSPQGT